MSNDGFSKDIFKGLKKFAAAMTPKNTRKLHGDILDSTALRLKEHLEDLTPRRTGRLAGSYKVGSGRNGVKGRVGGAFNIQVGTDVEYAKHVNDGYTQKKGQFVPGRWVGSTFRYDPGAKTGMVLTGKRIPGVHMFERAMKETRRDIASVAKREIGSWWRNLL